MALVRPDSALARLAPSPNHGPRAEGAHPHLLILHYTGMPTAEAAMARLRDPAAEVSAHYVVEEDGRIWQLVPESRRAWHAGRSLWKGEADINSASIGVEIVNPGHEGGCPPFAQAQIAATIALAGDIAARHRMCPEAVLAHSDIAPGRKRDPGEIFPWRTLHAAGIGHWVPPRSLAGGRFLAAGDKGEPVEALQALLALYGYGVPTDGRYDDATAAVVTAFQRHFRPARVDGVADASTIGTLRDLLAAL